MKNRNIDIDAELELLKMHRDIDLNINYTENLLNKVHSKLYQNKVKGFNFTYTFVMAMITLTLLTITTIFLIGSTCSEFDCNRNYYLNSIANSYSLDYEIYYNIN